MNVGIVGLGLIGGSLAKAFKRHTDYTILGMDTAHAPVAAAKLLDAIDDELTLDRLCECDVIIMATYPRATVDFLEKNASKIKKDTKVIDCGGVKRVVCEKCFEIASENGFTFVGGHPMAGTQFTGFKYSIEDMFDGASIILVPDRTDDISFLSEIKNIFTSIGFEAVTISKAEEHDEIIAFTSQLAHVVSNAYVKSPTAKRHKTFSAGSYKDLTRVAKLNENMWAELFIDNGDNLSNEIESLIAELSKYNEAIKSKDFDGLKELLKQGRELKEQIDGV